MLEAIVVLNLDFDVPPGRPETRITVDQAEVPSIPAGLRYAQRYQQLRKTEQLFVKKIMDTLLERPGSAPN